MNVRRIRISRKSRGQMELLPEVRRKPPQEFAEQLLRKNLITARSKTRRDAKSKNVKREIEKAYANIVRIRGIDFEEFVKALGQENLSVEGILKNRAVINPVSRNPGEIVRIKRSVEVIVKYVERKRKWEKEKKKHPVDVAAKIAAGGERKHLRDIGAKKAEPRIVEKPERKTFWGWIKSVFKRMFG